MIITMALIVLIAARGSMCLCELITLTIRRKLSSLEILALKDF